MRVVEDLDQVVHAIGRGGGVGWAVVHPITFQMQSSLSESPQGLPCLCAHYFKCPCIYRAAKVDLLLYDVCAEGAVS